MALAMREVLDRKLDHRIELITVVPTSSSWVKTQFIPFPLRSLFQFMCQETALLRQGDVTE